MTPPSNDTIQISVRMSTTLLDKLDKQVANGYFRNRNHAIEYHLIVGIRQPIGLTKLLFKNE